MAKVDKLEQKYQLLKAKNFNIEQYNKEKDSRNSENEDSKNTLRAKQGKLNYEISKLEEELKSEADPHVKGEKETRLNQLKKERKELLEEGRNTENNIDENIDKDGISDNLKEGFLKNQKAIDKIFDMREKTKESIAKLEKKLEAEKEEIKKYEEIEELEAKIEANKGEKTDISNEEYLRLVNELNEKKANLDKMPNIKKTEKEIKSKKMMVKKCNLAWKCLFRNESWEDIHLKAVNINKQKNQALESTIENKNLEEEQQQENQNDVVENENDVKEGNKRTVAERLDNWFFENEDEEKHETQEQVEEQENTSMVKYDEFAKKHPILSKFKNAFNKIAQKLGIKNAMKEAKEVVDDPEKIQKLSETMDTHELGIEDENKQPSPRDAFISMLREYSEPEYGKSERDARAQATIDLHKKDSHDQDKSKDDGEER